VLYFEGQHWLRILSTDFHRQWSLQTLDGTYLTNAQWQEMRCFILSHTPQGCQEEHDHCGLPNGWRA